MSLTELATEEELERMILEEVRLAGVIRHPNVRSLRASQLYVDSRYARISAHCELGLQIAEPLMHVASAHSPAALGRYVDAPFLPAAGVEVPL